MTAACATAGVDMFPDREDKAANAAAVAVCRRCPIRRKCARDALDRGEAWGTWGGLTEARRDSMKRHGKSPTTGAIAQRVNARRAEVTRLLGQGMKPPAIAARLGCTPDTVHGDLRVLRAGTTPAQRAAAKAEARAALDGRIDDMIRAGASIEAICREQHVGTGRVVARRRAIGVTA